MHKAGYVNIIGNPNVGKSTLMNALVGERLSIITSKAQTTRHRIMGIINEPDAQIVFSDTPGVLKPNYKLQEEMAVMKKMSLMVTMDSANMHLASLVGLRCISIWGATHRYAGFLGYNQSEEDCVELPLSCRPCSIYGNKPCKQGDYQCLNGIRPALLANNILNALK